MGQEQQPHLRTTHDVFQHAEPLCVAGVGIAAVAPTGRVVELCQWIGEQYRDAA